MATLGEFGGSLAGLIVGLIALGVLLIWWLRRSQDSPSTLALKWVLSAAVLGFLILVLVPALISLTLAQIIRIPFLIGGMFLSGFLLAALWAPNLIGWVSRPLENLFTGGDLPPEPVPLYSIAEAHRKKGQYDQAITEIRRQLERFPADVTGQLMLAEIQAQNLRDLPAARETIEQFCAQPGHAPENIWLALNSLAEWHLQYAQDIPSARQALEKIIELLPESAPAQRAAQRLAHLAHPEFFRAVHDRTPLKLKPGRDNIGLMPDSASLKRPDEDPEKQAAELALQLEEHPQDQSAREQLAILYATHYQDIRLAAEQLEILIGHSHQTLRGKARLLHLLADLQTRAAQPYDSVRETLQRIIDLNPDAATAAQARQRLDHLRLELKGREVTQVIKFSAEADQNGLKRPGDV